jgi:hypothetical protein
MGLKDQVGKLVSDSGAKHKRLIDYVVRQLHAGRSLSEVLEDPYVMNRLGVVDRRALLEEPEVIEAASEETLNAMRNQLELIAGE